MQVRSDFTVPLVHHLAQHSARSAIRGDCVRDEVRHRCVQLSHQVAQPRELAEVVDR